MSKKQYLDMPIGMMGNFERVLELYDNGIIQKRFRYSELDQDEIIDKYETEGYAEAASHSEVQKARKSFFTLSQKELFRPEQRESDLIMYCPRCATPMVVKGEVGSRRCYCYNCGSMFVETYDAEAIHQRSWKFIQTTGNNAIRGYLEIEEQMEKEARKGVETERFVSKHKDESVEEEKE